MNEKDFLSDEILDFFKYAVSNKTDNRSILSIGKLTPAGRRELEKLRGEPFKKDDVENDNGNLCLKSFYNTKKGPAQRVMLLMRSLLSTSVTYSGSTPSLDAKLPTFFETTKRFEGKIPLERNWRLRKLADDYGLPFTKLQGSVPLVCETHILP